MSLNAYQRTVETTASPRDVEYRAFGMVISRLLAAKTYAELVAACHLNNRLWTILASDLAHPDNKLPDELKARLLSLAIFSQKQSYKVMRKEAEVETLVGVNKEIMSGLASNQN